MKFFISLLFLLSVFALSAQTITITSPNGGEFYNANTAQTITWNSTGSVPPMDLFYTTDNGVNWTLYASGINAASGSYVWTVPNDPSNVCLIRFESGAIADTSDAVFSINFNNNAINLASPNGGEVYTGGSSQTVTWSTSGPVSALELFYSVDNGVNWVSYATGINAFSGSYSWTVPNVTSTNCLVRLTDGIATDESNAVFTINGVAPGSITVLQPNGGEFLTPGTSYNIQWITSGTVDPIDLYYSIDNGSNWTLISSGETGTSYNWFVPNASSTNCLIRLSDGVLADESDAIFTIEPDPTTIALTAPNGGEVMQGFDSFQITWDTVSNSYIDSVEIFFQETASFGPSFITVKNTGEFMWEVPNVSTTTAKIKVKLQGYSLSDESDADFSIDPIGLVLSNPNGGELLASGESYQINWAQIGSFTGVDISVSLDSGLTYSSVTSAVVDTFFVWNVPGVDTLNCIIKLDYQGMISDTSDATFRISPNSLELSNPNGGEVLVGGEPYQINWEQTGSISGVDVWVSLDSGLTYTALASAVVDTFYVWNVPNVDTLNCIVKVDYEGLWTDSSDAVFSIQYVDPAASVNVVTETRFIAYPNPTTGVVNFIDNGGFNLKNGVVSVYSMDGRLVFKDGNVKDVNLRDLGPGIYSIVLEGKDSKIYGSLRLVIID
jgi:hypothetical protein